MYPNSLLKYTEGRGEDFPIFVFCRYLVELGPRQLGLLVAEKIAFPRGGGCTSILPQGPQNIRTGQIKGHKKHQSWIRYLAVLEKAAEDPTEKIDTKHQMFKHYLVVWSWLVDVLFAT